MKKKAKVQPVSSQRVTDRLNRQSGWFAEVRGNVKFIWLSNTLAATAVGVFGVSARFRQPEYHRQADALPVHRLQIICSIVG